MRTHLCGQLRDSHIDDQVSLCGSGRLRPPDHCPAFCVRSRMARLLISQDPQWESPIAPPIVTVKAEPDASRLKLYFKRKLAQIAPNSRRYNHCR